MKKINIMWLIICIAMLGIGTIAKADDFSDTDGHWAENEIDYVISKEIMNGISDTEFAPDRILTRGEFFAITARTFKQLGSAEDAYNDVKASDWYSEYVSALKNNGLIPQEFLDSENNLNCDSLITREEAAALIWKAFYNAYRDDSYNADPSIYSDYNEIADYAKDAILKLTAAKIMNGATETEFNPQGTITAAQAAAIAERLRNTSAAYVAPITEDDGDKIEAEIRDAYNRGAVKIIIPEGEYKVPEGTQGISNRASILLNRIEDFTIEGENDNVRLVFTEISATGFSLQYCRNVKIKGFSCDHEHLMFSQGEIVKIEINDDKKSCIWIRIDDGYPNDLDDTFWTGQRTGYVVDPETEKMLPGYANVGFTMERDTSTGDDHLWKCQIDDQFSARQLTEGLLIVFRQGSVGCAMNTRITQSSGTVLENYTIHSGEMGLLEQPSGPDYVRTYLKNVKVIPGPKPEGATRNRLMSSYADGVHFTECEKGPLIENCEVVANGDDAVAIHGYYRMIMEEWTEQVPNKMSDYEPGQAWIIAGMWGNQNTKVGDHFCIYDSKGNKKAETRLAKKPVEIVSGHMSQNDKYNTSLSNKLGQMTLGAYSVYCFEDVLDLEYGDLIVNIDMIGSGYEVRNTKVSYTSTRAMLISANDGLIENCHIEGSRGGGIIILPEIGWAQGGFTKNLTIRNNYFAENGSSYNAGLGTPNTRGAIEISTDLHAINHENIIIDNNRFENNWGYDIEVEQTRGVIIQNNTFGPRSEGAKGLKHGDCIYAANCDDISVKSCNKLLDETRNFYVGYNLTNAKGLIPVSSYPLEVTYNQDGIWKYQYSPIGTNEYYDYNFVADAMEGYTPTYTWWMDSKGNYTYGGILSMEQVATGTDGDMTYTFVAPKDGKVEVQMDDGVRINPASVKSDGVKFKIYNEKHQIYPKIGWAKVLYDEPHIITESVVTEVKKGDRLHFRLNCLGNTYYDNIIFKPVVKYLEATAQATTEECSDPLNYTSINIGTEATEETEENVEQIQNKEE